MDIAGMSIGQFLDALASSRVAPSAGAVAAVTGATGVALGEMGCRHTIEHLKDEGDRATLVDLRDNLHSIRSRLIELAEADAIAVDDLRAMYDQPDPDRSPNTLMTAQKNVTDVPLEIAAVTAIALEYLVDVIEHATVRVTPDVAVGAHIIQVSLRTTVWLSQINAAQVEDPAFEAEVESQTNEIVAACSSATNEIVALLEDEYDVTLR